MEKTNEVTWVRLHLVPQTESNAMPDNIVGILTQETATSFVLMKVLEQNDETFEIQATEGMSFINRTYVWRCEILPEPPQLENIEEEYNGEGGLG